MASGGRREVNEVTDPPKVGGARGGRGVNEMTGPPKVGGARGGRGVSEMTGPPKVGGVGGAGGAGGGRGELGPPGGLPRMAPDAVAAMRVLGARTKLATARKAMCVASGTRKLSDVFTTGTCSLVSMAVTAVF